MSAPVVVIRPPVPYPDADNPNRPGPVYANHVEFYDRYLSQVFARDPEVEPGWCPEWRDHPAAENGADALWRSWEVLQQDPGAGLASWWANLAIPIMRELLDDRGTFAGCSTTRHTPTTRPLP